MLRMRVAELMDDPKLAPELHADALRGLDRLNAVSLTAKVLWKELRSFSEARELNVKSKQSVRPIRVLDIATGSGNTLVRLARYASQHRKTFEFVGIDFSSTAVELATERARLTPCVEFRCLNALTDPLPSDFDIVMTSLFTHHLDPEQVIELLAKMSKTGAELVLVNDLVRTPLSWVLVWLGTRIFSRSPVVHFDGPVSVQASYTQAEMLNMAAQAGLHGCTVKTLWPCRQLLVWRKTS